MHKCFFFAFPFLSSVKCKIAKYWPLMLRKKKQNKIPYRLNIFEILEKMLNIGVCVHATSTDIFYLLTNHSKGANCNFLTATFRAYRGRVFHVYMVKISL